MSRIHVVGRLTCLSLTLAGLSACTGSSSSSSSSSSGGGSTSSSSGGGSQGASSQAGGSQGASSGSLASSARSSGSRASGGGSGGCGNVTAAGQCSGTTLQVCDTETDPRNPELFEFDCATELTGVVATCGTVGEGVNCVSPAGGPCRTEEGTLSCPGTGAGCLHQAADGGAADREACATGLPACTRPASGVYPNTCTTDNRLIYDCLQGAQPEIYDCATFAGGATTCSVTAGQGHCDMPLNTICDQFQGNTYPIFVCQAGGTCSGATQTQNGRCVAGGSSGPRPSSGTAVSSGGSASAGNSSGAAASSSAAASSAAPASSAAAASSG